PQSAWGSRLPPEILVRIFQAAVEQEGAVPFLCRVARVCRLWCAAAAEPRLWRRVSLGGCWGEPTPGRPPHTQRKVLGTVRWLAESRWVLGGPPPKKTITPGPPTRDPQPGTPHPNAPPPPRLAPGSRSCRSLFSAAGRATRVPQVEPSAVAAFLGAAGPRLRQLCLSCGPRLGTVLAALASGCCPDLRLLELDTALGGTGPPLPLPVERLQAACPHLQVLRLLNLSWTARGSRRADPPGFPRLEELSLAGAGGVGVGDEVLRRLLRASGR
ncbi:FBXL6 protein, partial [Haliaeetus albicilla]|nr:FBXL6 protein [Haliaeetus albicilla]